MSADTKGDVLRLESNIAIVEKLLNEGRISEGEANALLFIHEKPRQFFEKAQEKTLNGQK